VNQITVTGMVLAESAFDEYDRRVVILTKERGKIAAFAKGARRPNNTLHGKTSPFYFGEFVVYEGRTSYKLVSASISNYFSELREDMESVYYGWYFLELVNYYAREANNETMTLKLLYQTLRALVNPKIPNKLIRYIFELKLITINGEGPQMQECVCCSEKGQWDVFSVMRGGIVCGECLDRVLDGVKLKPATLYTIQYIVSSPVEKLYNFVVKEDVLLELGKVVSRYIAEYNGKTFKSLEILETIV